MPLCDVVAPHGTARCRVAYWPQSARTSPAGVTVTVMGIKDAGIPDGEIDDYMKRVDQLPNLQLLPGGPNIEKSELPLELSRFLAFFEGRRARMRQRLVTKLGPETAAEGSAV